MIVSNSTSVALQLRTEREELSLLNRTVTHWLTLASEKSLLAGLRSAEHSRRVPSVLGARRDSFFWQSWDWSVRGEDDLRRFFEIAQRIGSHLRELQAVPEAAGLLPGTVEETLGTATDLFLPDYWLLVVHHLGWEEELPYECEMKWKCGSSFQDVPFCVTSRLPVNVAQASMDALTVLIDAMPHRDHDGQAGQYATRCVPQASSVPVLPQAPTVSECHASSRAVGAALCPPSAAVDASSPRPRRRMRKRAERAANIEALKKELEEHVRAARDHAQAAVDHGHEPLLLPRPSQRELAARIGITESAASRCFRDPGATELDLLWRTAGDLDAILKFVRR